VHQLQQSYENDTHDENGHQVGDVHDNLGKIWFFIQLRVWVLHIYQKEVSISNGSVNYTG